MNLEDINFDDFMTYESKLRKKIINDPELLKIMISKNLKKTRYDHSLSVADLSRELAKIHHVDPDKAYVAGLLH
ncbi:MAG: HD domain-containing protein, partial [Erysipelotrichaceae bacterium]|nr:HD domain-containing protein [Erysipelotrichaceae bacterium]